MNTVNLYYLAIKNNVVGIASLTYILGYVCGLHVYTNVCVGV